LKERRQDWNGYKKKEITLWKKSQKRHGNKTGLKKSGERPQDHREQGQYEVDCTWENNHPNLEESRGQNSKKNVGDEFERKLTRGGDAGILLVNSESGPGLSTERRWGNEKNLVEKRKREKKEKGEDRGKRQALGPCKRKKWEKKTLTLGLRPKKG